MGIETYHAKIKIKEVYKRKNRIFLQIKTHYRIYHVFKGAGYSDYSCQSKEKLSANNTSTNTRKLKLGTELRYY